MSSMALYTTDVV